MSPVPSFLNGGGEATRLILARDWSDHPLGPPERWPDALRVALSLVLNSPESMILAWGPDLHFFFNETYFPLLGPRLPWAMGERFDKVWQDGWAQAKPIIDEAMSGHSRRFVDLPWTLDTDRGQADTWWTFSYSRVLDADGAVAGLFILTNETTSRVLSDAALRESESRYRTLFNSLDQGFCVVELIDDPVGTPVDYLYVEANAACARHAGLHDIVGRTARDLLLHEAEDWIARLGEVMATGLPTRFERELELTGRHLDVAAFRLEPASRRQVAVLFQDITDRKRAEADLRRFNERLESRVVEAVAERDILADLVEGTNAFVQVADTDFRWLAVNGAAAREFERIFGVLPRVGANMLDVLDHMPEHREAVRAIWARALAGEEFVETGEFGDSAIARRHYEMHFNTLRGPDGRRIGAYQFVYDVTERMRAQERLSQTEEALRQAQKMEAIGQLTGGLAHDFNNLLAGISGSLEMMRTRIDQGRMEHVERYMTAAQGAARRAAALTHRLLAFSRRQTLAPRPTDVNGLVAGMVELIRRTVGPSVEIEVVGLAGLWPTLVDPPQLENALLNLCINARDAMPNGGRITIETANERLDEARARRLDMQPGEYLSLCVADQGTGMSPEVVARAFEPFFTTKPLGEGTGLGLSMIYGFAKQSGGQVGIESEVGRGTRVCTYLPRHHGPVGDDAAAGQRTEAHRAGNGETVLVVDDEPTVRMLIVDLLAELGYTAIEAADGAAGLEVLRQDLRIDLLVTDIGLPGGLNGRQMAHAARETRPDLKVLFITGYAETAALGAPHLEPGTAVLTKPFAVEALGDRIREMLAQR